MSQKMQSQQSRIIMGSKNRARLFRSATMPADFVSSYATAQHDSKLFPSMRNQNNNNGGGNNNNNSPRVLVWGSNSDENAGKKLVAVGDRVSATISTECSKITILGFVNTLLLNKNCQKKQPIKHTVSFWRWYNVL